MSTLRETETNNFFCPIENDENDESDEASETQDEPENPKIEAEEDSDVDEETVENEQNDENNDLFQISTEPTAPKEASESENESNSEEEMEANELFQISKEPTESKVKTDSESEPEPEPEPKSKKRKKTMKNDNDSRKYPKYNQAVEQSLEKFLFGKVSKQVLEPESSDEESEPEMSKQKPQWSSIQSGSDSDSESSDSEGGKSKLKPAWHDEDDEEVLVKDVTETYAKAKGKHGKKETSKENYAKSLRKQFRTLMDTPQWADLSIQKEIEDSDDEFFRETTDVLAKKGSSLESGFLEFRKLKDVNITTHNEGAIIRCAEFHPNAAIGLVAGNNGTASLFQVDGKVNAKLQSVHFENFPIKTGHFTADGKQFLVGSQHFGHFFAYDMVKNATIKIPYKEDREQRSMQKFEVCYLRVS